MKYFILTWFLKVAGPRENTWIQSCPSWAQHIEIFNVGGSKMRALGPGISISPCREKRSLSLSEKVLNGLHFLHPSGIP